MLMPHNTQIVVFATVDQFGQLPKVLATSSVRPTLRCPAELPELTGDYNAVRVNYVLPVPGDFGAMRHRAVSIVRDAANAVQRKPGGRLAIINIHNAHTAREFAAALRYLDNRGICYDVINL